MEDKYLYAIIALIVAFGVIVLSRKIKIKLPGFLAEKDDSRKDNINIDGVSGSGVKVKDKGSGDIVIKDIKEHSNVDVDRN